ncbi:hypothetical protein [Saccharibacter sp. 17.LH.SD]|uniref:hypothetical protein n=1 Tax=Saccharibacter sp. 17.LH.SD TaxID=2689393 RepID=UPI0019272CAF|nr:hypothetical protein [Saccharibacter sp. 17.LH.SD]
MHRYVLLPVIALSLFLTGCATHKVHHPGLSSDGYGFVKNGPTLSPPEHLLQPVPPHQ